MKVINIHTRLIHQPKHKIAAMLATLATPEDAIIATDRWPRVFLDKGLVAGSLGGHGPIGYVVREYVPGEFVEFSFTKPLGFEGTHKFEMLELQPGMTEMKHIIHMNVRGTAILQWALVIRWLHDAFIEDAFDKVENHFIDRKKSTPWNFWVVLLRKVLRRRR